MRRWIVISCCFLPVVNAWADDQCLRGCSINSLPGFILNTEYSNRYNLVVNPHYVNVINSGNALALEIAFGASEFRLGATLAHAFNLRQRLKATTEYLSQDHTFHFDCGDKTQWTEQSSFALMYQYWLGRGFLDAFNISGYHSHARDEQIEASLTCDSTTTSQRDFISGSDSNGLLTGLTFLPTQYTFVDIDLIYDHIHYSGHDTRQGVGERIRIKQIISPRISVNFSASHRILYNELNANLAWMVFQKNNNFLELALTAKYIDGDNIPEPNETRIGLVLAYRWDASCPHANCNDSACDHNLKELEAWSLEPAVRMPRTFVLQDDNLS